MDVEFWIDGEKFCGFPYFMWKLDGMYLMRLQAISLNPGSKSVYPVYQPGFEFSIHGGQAVLTLFKDTQRGQRAFVITAQRRWPFLSITRNYITIRTVEIDDEN